MAFVTDNPQVLARRFRARGAGLGRALQRSSQRGAPLVGAESRRVMEQNIYTIPEKRGPTGRKLWERTGNLLRNEKAHARGGSIVLENRARSRRRGRYYARYRYVMRPRAPQRSIQWQEVAFRNLRRPLLRVRQEEVRRLLENP